LELNGFDGWLLSLYGESKEKEDNQPGKAGDMNFNFASSIDHLDKDPASVVVNAIFASAEAEGTPNRLLKKEKSATEPQRKASRN